MARTTGPLMSLTASGSVAKTLTYAHWKGRPYVRQLVTPSNPRSVAQYYTRTMMTFLSQAWKHINSYSGTAQADWDELAKQGNFSAFNAFVKAGMMRWTQGQGPLVSPAFAGGATGDTINSMTPTAGVRQIAVTIASGLTADGFAYALAIDPANSATPALTQTRDIALSPNMTAITTQHRLISQLDPGTYSICLFQTTTNGTITARSNVTQGLVVT